VCFEHRCKEAGGVRMIQEAVMWRRGVSWQRDDRGRRRAAVFDSGVLPAAPVKGESVLLVAAQAQGRSTGTDIARGKGIDRGAANFALVSDEPGATDAASSSCWGTDVRLRIRKGVDEETLRAVLAAVEPVEMLSFRRPAKCICARYRADMRRSFDGCP